EQIRDAQLGQVGFEAIGAVRGETDAHPGGANVEDERTYVGIDLAVVLLPFGDRGRRAECHTDTSHPLVVRYPADDRGREPLGREGGRGECAGREPVPALDARVPRPVEHAQYAVEVDEQRGRSAPPHYGAIQASVTRPPRRVPGRARP